MRAGLMRYRITFQRQVSSETVYSDSEPTYDDCFTTWADIRHNSGNRSIEANEIVNPFTVKITIRYYHQVDYGMTIKHGDIRYRILDINPERSKNCITITAEVINE